MDWTLRGCLYRSKYYCRVNFSNALSSFMIPHFLATNSCASFRMDFPRVAFILDSWALPSCCCLLFCTMCLINRHHIFALRSWKHTIRNGVSCCLIKQVNHFMQFFYLLLHDWINGQWANTQQIIPTFCTLFGLLLPACCPTHQPLVHIIQIFYFLNLHYLLSQAFRFMGPSSHCADQICHHATFVHLLYDLNKRRVSEGCPIHYR